ncbi:hypothetical protein JDV02_009633 [Purpureocillium takamizusanense]|uniref:Tetratricopeptide repeat protein 15 n=1 Tax=Purpureocillium takamizusanense TaxID=2060973 RepID=A0A9Q8VGE3_9HYPO|nr:uncharacterized protein JDV02_009633 [Purpureocillium takamizusanense]UNI23839.1 hypothetical protein JDV02_009633 [Purpureocillium takamizusanense]
MSQPPATPSAGHSRNKPSVTASSRPRSSTKGPLDADDHHPQTSPSTPQSQPSPRAGQTPWSAQHQQQHQQHQQLPRRTASRNVASPAVTPVGAARAKDFSFLLRPDIYHPLTPLNVPQAFRNSPKQPDPTASLDELLARGHFRAAAIAAVQQLTGSGLDGDGVDPTDADRIFSLLYTRLACLTLIDATPLAAHEVKALEDLNNARAYVDDATGEHLVPWELRVLNVRLQSLGFNDPRRAVMSYHELAREARDRAKRDGAARDLWRARLHDLGIKVAGALVDMGDLPGAAHHLAGLHDTGDAKVVLSRALLWLRLGDADRARACVAQCADAPRLEQLVLALCDMADADYVAALARWQELREALPGDEMVGVNTAVCLLYLGRMHEGREILEGLVAAGQSSHTLLFNLSTMYELCTERNRNLKLKLAERVAAMDESPSGWERMNADFKL